MSSYPESSALTRRQIIQGTVALAATSFWAGCSASGSSPELSSPTNSSPPDSPPAPANPQPVPAGPVTQASLTITSAAAGSIGPAFAGLSYEKNKLSSPIFTASNSDLIALFKRIGPSVLRIGGNTVDQNVWAPNGAGQTAGQIAPSDVASLAGFVKAAGWQCL